MQALEAARLNKTYRTLLSRRSHRALQEIELAVPLGARVALLGANGSGKTTLLKVFATLIRPDEGRVRVHGHDLARQPQAARRLLSFVAAEGRGLDQRLSGRQNALFFGALHRISERAASRRLSELTEEWRLAALLDRPVGQLSSGERQRLALALALLNEPSVLLLDEPTRSLDPPSVKEVWSLLLRRAMTVLWASHDPEGSFAHADGLLVLQAGTVAAYGPPTEVAPLGRESLCRWYQMP